MRQFTSAVLIGLLALTPLALAVNDSDSKPPLRLIEIVRKLEQQGYGPIHEISRERGNWEVEVMKGKDSYESMVDAKTGEVLSQHSDDPERQPPQGSLPLSELLEKVAKDSGYTDVEEVSFERRYWEIEVRKEGVERELHVDPITAKIISDRIDD